MASASMTCGFACWTAFEEIRRSHENQTIAIVSHGGVNRILIAWALRIPNDCLFRIAQDYAAVNLLEFVDGVPMVRLLNYTGMHTNKHE